MQSNKLLYFMVEGPTDERFVDHVIKPLILTKYTYRDIRTYKYARHPKEQNYRFINTVESNQDDIICLSDINSSPCIRSRKYKLTQQNIGNLDESNIVVVIKMIESWYLAGLDNTCCKRLGINSYHKTDSFRKTHFHSLIAKSKYRPKINCMLEMLKIFNVDTATSKNKSFSYFYRKYLQ